nr:AbrB/MazE/SpoVT family DNA-binding domain-containing protein [uncultured Fretibacterium sp.]
MISIPSKITRALSLTPATAVRLEVRKGRIIVTPCERPPEYSLQQLVSMTDFSDRDAAWLGNEAERAELI